MLKSGGEAMLSTDRPVYGCLFCATGKEKSVLESIRLTCSDVRATTARQEKFKTDHGKKTKVTALLLPGYVFFETSAPSDTPLHFPHDGIIRLLTDTDGCWQLYGDDERFVRWLFSYNGLLPFSTAYQEGTRIRVIDGPLKDMEGFIRRIDKRGHSGQITVSFNHRELNVWLAFDLVEKIAPPVALRESRLGADCQDT